jgi:hypothetical protein
MDTADDRRQFWRATFHSPVLLVGHQGSVPADLIDISLKGALIKVPPAWPVRVDEACRLELQLADDASIVMHGRVVHVANRRIGVYCERIDIDSITHLRRLVELNSGDPELLERELAILMAGE